VAVETGDANGDEFRDPLTEIVCVANSDKRIVDAIGEAVCVGLAEIVSARVPDNGTVDPSGDARAVPLGYGVADFETVAIGEAVATQPDAHKRFDPSVKQLTVAAVPLPVWMNENVSK
jgi:hypothetical protein